VITNGGFIAARDSGLARDGTRESISDLIRVMRGLGRLRENRRLCARSPDPPIFNDVAAGPGKIAEMEVRRAVVEVLWKDAVKEHDQPHRPFRGRRWVYVRTRAESLRLAAPSRGSVRLGRYVIGRTATALMLSAKRPDSGIRTARRRRWQGKAARTAIGTCPVCGGKAFLREPDRREFGTSSTTKNMAS